MMPPWLSRLCRRVVRGDDRGAAPARDPEREPTPAPPPKIELRSANTNPNPAPAGGPPVSQTKPSFAGAGPDLEFVGTKQLYTEIASRYDESVLVCVRRDVRDDARSTSVFLSAGVDRPADFLRSAADITQDLPKREIRDGDL